MATVIASNNEYKGRKDRLPGALAPMPDNANVYCDFENSLYIIKYASGTVTRSRNMSEVLSFTRASTATRINEAGIIEYLGPGEPAIDYHPVTHECMGFRAEYESTNRIADSADFTVKTSWLPVGIGIVKSAAIAPDGNKTATRISAAASNGAVSVRALKAITTIDAITGQPYTFSVFIKKDTGTVVQLAAQGAVPATQFANFNLSTGVVTRVSALTLQATIEPYQNGWFRCSVTIAPSVDGAPDFTIALVNNDSGAQALPGYAVTAEHGVYIWGAQGERRDGSTSYIPTSGAEEKRESEICTTPTLANFFNAQAGTVFVKHQHPESLKTVSGAYSSLACASVLDNGVAGAHIRFAYRAVSVSNPKAALAVIDANANTQNLEVPSMAQVRGSEQSVMFGFDAAAGTVKLFDGFNWFRGSVAAFPPALSRMCFGRSYIGSGNFFNGYIKKAIYFPQSLSDQQIEEMVAWQG